VLAAGAVIALTLLIWLARRLWKRRRRPEQAPA
jgi:hypothetical protein